MCNCTEIRQKLREALVNARVAEAVRVMAEGAKEMVGHGKELFRADQ